MKLIGIYLCTGNGGHCNIRNIGLTLCCPLIIQEHAAGLATLGASLKEVEGYAAAQVAEAQRLTDALTVSERRSEEQSHVIEADGRSAQAAQVFGVLLSERNGVREGVSSVLGFYPATGRGG